MNKTKKLTLGAMLLAIVGALMLIDRQLSFLFEEFIILAMPLVIVIYSVKYTVKDGAVLSFCLLVLSVLFGSTYSYMYTPVSIIVGLGYSIGINKGLDRTKLSLIAMGLYILGEVCITFVVSPIMGIDIASQLTAYTDSLKEAGLSDLLIQTGLNSTTFLLSAFIAATIIIGLMEGYITSLLTIILLNRLNIKNVGSTNLLDIKLSPVASYILFGLSMLMFFVKPDWFSNEAIYDGLVCVLMIASLVLAYFGYIFVTILGRITMGKKSLIIIILAILLLFPVSYLALLILGFLYGSGPLRSYIERRVVTDTNNQ